MLADFCLNSVDILTAKRIYRQVLCNVGMVMTLEELEWIDDKDLLSGHIAAMLGNVNVAQVIPFF